uniref:Failed axon connections homolog n=1 Tax=Syphacia muris TaxID=451379 RepID=A0A0N5A9S2_9BILA
MLHTWSNIEYQIRKTVGDILIVVAVLLIVRWLFTLLYRCIFHYPNIFKKLHDKHWQHDVVYLHQFKKSAAIPNLSPFCLKLESWLRANKIKFKVCESWFVRSREGLLPFIELNGEQIADSQLILSYLQDHFNLHDDLTAEEKGIARAVDRMIEGSTFYCLLYSKAYENAANLMSRDISGLPFPRFITKFLSVFGSILIHKRLDANGVSRHKREDIIAILRKDIQAIDNILGDKTFLLGAHLTAPDFTAFGHLATAYYLPYDQPIKKLLNDEFPRVKAYIQRIRQTLFPHWNTDEMATNSATNTLTTTA